MDAVAALKQPVSRDEIRQHAPADSKQETIIIGS
jgi:hypothetical protein